ncbi:MAG: hypothetical protein ACMUJM_08090 [bacterium]
MVICLSLVLICFPTGKASALGDPEKHFLVSFPVGFGADTYLYYHTDLETPHRIAVATVLGTLPGFIKEIIDDVDTSYYNYFNQDDLIADAFGALAGACVSSFCNCFINIKVRKTKSISLFMSFVFPL